MIYRSWRQGKYFMTKLQFVLTDKNSREEIYSLYLKIIAHVDAVFTKIALNHFIVPNCMDTIVSKLFHNYKYFIPFTINAERLVTKQQAKNAVDTAVLSAAVAVSKNLSLNSVRKITEAALLHDAGMLCIPDEVLNKKESLSVSDYKYILTHTVQTYKIIEKELDCSKGVEEIALQHHEAWNGKGYPKKLSGKDILPEARIIAVTSAFVAMNSDRLYRPSLGIENAVAKIVSNAGIQFDPEIVKAFVHHNQKQT